METTYTIQGVDGQHYGPVTLENLQAWLREGRVTAGTQVLRSDLNAWHPAGSYSELGLAGAPAVRMTGPAAPGAAVSPVSVNPERTLADSPEVADLERRIKNGASWFYWIAAFSVINSVVAMTGNGIGFALGLSITQFVDLFARGVAGVGLAVGVLAAGGLVLLGIFAHRKQTWAFLVGVLLYGLDSALTVFFAVMSGSLWISVAIHAWALFSLVLGLRANLKYQQWLRGA